MLKELKEKLDNLPENYAKDIDIVALKALCTVPETEEIVAHVKGLVEKLEAKYVNDDEIKNLVPKDEMTLEKLVELLEEKYATNIDFITLKAIMNLEDSKEKEKTVKIYLNKINPEDEDIKKYLNSKKVKNPYMVFVKGGFYKAMDYYPLDLYVSKYQVTQENWEKLMGKNPSTFIGERKPVENITWWEALEFCNKLSEKEGLSPIYKIENNDLKIIHLDGEEVFPYLADFSKTEGYRLPTEYEWEWFASGGEEAIKNDTFDTKYAGSNTKDVVAWNSLNAKSQTHDVGLKKMNELGLYDCSGNVFEWCYDTTGHYEGADKFSQALLALDKDREKPEIKYFDYDSTIKERVIKGGSWSSIEDFSLFSGKSYNDYCEVLYGRGAISTERHIQTGNWLMGVPKTYEGTIGLRVVRTANPVI